MTVGIDLLSPQYNLSQLSNEPVSKHPILPNLLRQAHNSRFFAGFLAPIAAFAQAYNKKTGFRALRAHYSPKTLRSYGRERYIKVFPIPG